MPRHKTHVAGATLFFLILFYFNFFKNFNTLKIISLYLVFIMGTFFPDIDISSNGRRLLFPIFFGAFIFSLIKKQTSLAILIIFTWLAAYLASHRGFFHSLWFVSLFAFVFYLISRQLFAINNLDLMSYLAIFVLGSFVHIFLDKGFKF